MPTLGEKFDRQSLIFDADDTLWENNVYFERSVDEFLDFLAHSALSRDEVRAVLDEIERANLAVHGYGARAFAANLRQCYERLAERAIDAASLATVMAFGERILSQELEPIAGVAETLAYLAPRHDLTLLTKGHPEEQRLKIDRSGLAGFFRHAEVVAEKDAAAYHALVERLGLDPERTWMVGNSPKSDINPALAAGLNAVFIPHPATWRLEHAEVAAPPPGRQLLELARFAELREHF
ncbi:MAG: HAD hydrolase-like protein [Chloroflexia bacterium]|nr:HAD hydrolase-like protein [Chloroflexia bacterium]